MANYNGLKSSINNNIYENQTQQITGTVLNAILNEMVTTLGAGYQFAGVAYVGMIPAEPDGRIFYLAGEGIYTSFDGIQVPQGKLGILKWDSRWHLETIDGLGGGANLTGYVTVASTDDLPDEGVATLGYLCGTNLYLYVGEGGDTKEGKYQNCGSFRGPQGDSVQDVEQTQTSHENGGVNKIKFTLSNGQAYEFQVRNGTTSTGLFPTLADLQAAYPSPVVGQYAFVGSGFPADIYVCTTAGTWTDSGEDYDGDNVDLTDYATKAEVNELDLKVDDLPNIKGLQNLWQMTSHGTFLNAQGNWSNSTDYDACQLEMTPGATYWVYPPLRTALGASQPATRVFKKVGTTYTQVWYQIQGGGKVAYTCLDDGNTYIIQLASPRKKSFSDVVGTPRIYLMNKQPKSIYDIEGKLFLPDLWEVTYYHGFIDGTGAATNNNNYNSCQLYDVVPGHTYAVRMQLVGSGVGNYLRIFSVASNGALSQVFSQQQNGGVISYTIPDDGNAYMMQVATRVNSSEYPNDGPAPEIYDIAENIPYRMGRYNKLRVLFIANSHARDAFSYMPAILESIVPGIDLTLGILYKGGCTLAEHYSYISNGTAYEAFDKYTTSYGKWVTTTDSLMTTCDAALADEKWDIIVLQQRSILSGDYSTYQPYANDIVALLFGKVGHAVQIGFNMTYAVADNYSQQPDEDSDAQYENIASATQLLLKDTPFQFVIPTATAIQNARQTTLKSLGTFGDMTYDGLHIQEGIPCITAAYCACLKFLDIMGEKKFGVLGSIFRPSDNWVTSEGVPQKHGSCVGITNENNFLLAQRCAMAANLFPFEITPPIQ